MFHQRGRKTALFIGKKNNNGPRVEESAMRFNQGEGGGEVN